MITKVEDLRPLTSLRFLAAMLIVLHHATNYFPWARPFHLYPLNQGVSFFFVLSGFILTHVYLHRQSGVGSFLLARFARIYPVHLVTCLMVIAFIRADSQQLPGTGFFNPWVVLVSNLTLTQSLVPFINYTFSWNSVSWSISTEAFFYLAFPFLLINLEKTWGYKLALFAAVLPFTAVLVWLLGIPASTPPTELNVYFLVISSPLLRGFEFVLGMSAYVIWKRHMSPNVSVISASALEVIALSIFFIWCLGLFGAAGACFQFSTVLAAWFSHAGSAWICAIIIVVLAHGKGIIGQVLSLRLFVWLGEISFALYMSHQIIMKWMFIKYLEGAVDQANVFVTLGVCILGAALLHHFIEKPARQWILRRAPSAAMAKSEKRVLDRVFS